MKDFIENDVGESLADLIDEGMIEVSSIDNDGKFTYRLTEKGRCANNNERTQQEVEERTGET